MVTIIHCAARISVPESVEKPELYHKENVEKSEHLFNEAIKAGFKNIILSSSASVYGEMKDPVVYEDSTLNPGSPYAKTKIDVEKLLDKKKLTPI